MLDIIPRRLQSILFSSPTTADWILHLAFVVVVVRKGLLHAHSKAVIPRHCVHLVVRTELRRIRMHRDTNNNARHTALERCAEIL